MHLSASGRARRVGSCALVVCSLLVIASGCRQADVTSSAPAAPTSVVAGPLEGLPVLPRAEAVGGPTREAAARTASYRVDGVLPQAVLSYFSDHLDRQEWSVLEPPQASGADTWRGSWVSGNRRLEVVAERLGASQTATSDVGTGGTLGAQVSTQYSIVLRDT
jgi:hypothetical protein